MANKNHDSHFPQSTIVDQEGKRYTYMEAADYLGLNYHYFLKRLKNWRNRGVFHLSIEFLQIYSGSGRPSNEAKNRALALLPPAAYSPSSNPTARNEEARARALEPSKTERSIKNVHDTCRRPEIPAQ